MNLYLVERTDHVSYDEYDSLIVCASSEADAKSIHPPYGWVGNDRITVKKIGVAIDNVEAGIVLGSFNAG